jgi:peptidyl-prolyl cis-trans isomerase C
MAKSSKKTEWKLYFLTFWMTLGFGAILWMQYQNLSLNRDRASYSSLGGGGRSHDPEMDKKFGNKLAEEHLFLPAIESYQSYLQSNSSVLDATQQANLYYRMGELADQAQNWEKALAFYHKSEILEPSASYANNRSRKMIACLEKMGRFHDANYTLSKASALKTSEQSPALSPSETLIAKIQGEPLSLNELQKVIQFLPKGEQDRLKDPQAQKEFARHYVAKQVLLRKAKKLNLQDDPELRQRLQWLSEELILQKLLDQERQERIRIDPLDIQNYYQAHPERFAIPAQLSLSHLLCAKESEALSLQLQIESGALSFEEAAQKYSLDEKTKNQGGRVSTKVPNLPQRPVAFLGNLSAPEFLQKLFEIPEGQARPQLLASPQGYHLVKVHEIQPARQRSFEEAQQDVCELYEREKLKNLEKDILQESLNSTDVEFFEQAFSLEPEKK